MTTQTLHDRQIEAGHRAAQISSQLRAWGYPVYRHLTLVWTDHEPFATQYRFLPETTVPRGFIDVIAPVSAGASDVARMFHEVIFAKVMDF